MYNLTDNDLYKFTMMQFSLHQMPSIEVEAKLIVRSKIDLRPFKEEIEAEIDKLCVAKMTQTELEFLKTKSYLTSDFIYFLEDFSLKRRFVSVYEENGQLQIRIKGPWVQVILFEVPLLAIIEEVYSRHETIEKNLDVEKIGMENLLKKIDYLNTLEHPFFLIDMGTRRRYSRQWHEKVVKTLKEKCPSFLGTSNVWLANKYNLNVFGTMAHEAFMVMQGSNDTQLVNSQKHFLELWSKEYNGDLGIALTDTIGIDAFLKDFDLYLAKLYDGVRHDSGDPIYWGERMLEHYKQYKIDAKNKSLVFSDNLNFEKANTINLQFKDRARVLFGIGTFLTNDVGLKPLSIVIKIAKSNNSPVAKLSDEANKEMCEDPEFLHYIKKVFKKV
jgi:nicotinate phosphoribosyltransferase